MPTAAKILVVGGMGNLILGLITGAFMVRVRMASREVPRYLTLTHLGALMWAPILLGLVWAARLSHLTAWVATLAAWLLLGGSVGVDARDLLYWLRGVRDEFAERPAAFILGPVSAVATATGTLILLIGVVQAL